MTPPLVYVAGAIDYAESAGDHIETGPAHFAEFWPDGVGLFCPRCENAGEESLDLVMHRNWGAVNDAAVVVAFLDASVLSVGTPIEIWEKAKQDAGAVVLVHWSKSGTLGVFARWWQSRGVEVINAVDGLSQNEEVAAAVHSAVRRKLALQ